MDSQDRQSKVARAGTKQASRVARGPRLMIVTGQGREPILMVKQTNEASGFMMLSSFARTVGDKVTSDLSGPSWQSDPGRMESLIEKSEKIVATTSRRGGPCSKQSS